MREKIGKRFIAFGIMLMVIAAIVFAWNQFDSFRAGLRAQEVMQLLEDMIQSNTDTENNSDMTVKEIDGYGYIGYLTIDKIDLQLPVMSEWDYDRLKIAPCRYSGSVKSDDIVIAAHNYTRHFGKLSRLSSGDRIAFKDMDGVVTNYEVVLIDVLSSTAIEDMVSGEFDLTLFTCTYGGQNRITIRCDRIATDK